MGILSFQMWLSRHTRTHTHRDAKGITVGCFYLFLIRVSEREREKEWKSLRKHSHSFFQSLFLMSHLEQSLFSPCTDTIAITVVAIYPADLGRKIH